MFGNVTRQELAGGSTYENYGYDKLMRLTAANRGGGASGSVGYAYDGVGNFTSKSDYSTTAASAYTYTGGACGGGPNAVKSVALAGTLGGGTRTLCYDANGNLASYSTSGGTAESFAAKYDHDNLPYRTIRAGTQVDLTYDADGGRVRQSGADGTRLYDGAYEKVLTPSVEHKVYLGDYAVLTRPSGGALNVKYLLKDRLGSVDTVTDATGNVVETRGYDAFGKPRQGSWADAVPPKLGTIANTPRGFTQHEHLNAVALIHMNGRAYDYQLGRFLSVDPIIQFPTNSQSLNPYSYILNNPLAGTDPTGYASSICDRASTHFSSGTCGDMSAVAANVLSTLGRLTARMALAGISNGGRGGQGAVGPQGSGGRGAAAAGGASMLGIATAVGASVAMATHVPDPNGGPGHFAPTAAERRDAKWQDYESKRVFLEGLDVSHAGRGQRDAWLGKLFTQGYPSVAIFLLTGSNVWQSNAPGDDSIQSVTLLEPIAVGLRLPTRPLPPPPARASADDMAAAILAARALGDDVARDLTYLYQKIGPNGQHLKFGITRNPLTRYTQAELGGGRLRIVAWGSRQEMLRLERSLHETLPIGAEERQLFYIRMQLERGLSAPPYN